VPAHDRAGTLAKVAVPEVTPAEASAMLSRGAVQLVDVREPWEYEEAHIPNCRLIPMGQVPGRLEEIDRETPAVIYCRSGSRSGKVVALLREHGYDKTLNLAGGILAWANAQLPIQ